MRCLCHTGYKRVQTFLVSLLEFKSIFDVPLKGKTVLLRVDINSSVVEGRVVVSSRLREHAKTIYSLSEEGAKVVVLSHQGRKGEADFISLKRHADFLKKFLDKEVRFAAWEEDFVSEIESMKDGDVLVLENTRFLGIETMEEKSPKEFEKETPIKELLEVGDYFVQNALSVCHRNHATVVGFSSLPSFVGPVLEKELIALKKLDIKEDKKLLILGGGKPLDSIMVLYSMLEKKFCDTVCLGGLFGEMFLRANGTRLGKKEAYLDKKGYLEMEPKIKEILKKFGDRIMLPIDLGAKEDDGRKEIRVLDLPTEMDLLDIGVETTELFKKKIRESKTVVFNGPLGVYEEKSFSLGTKKILETIAFGRCFSIVGGGDTEKAIFAIGLLPQDFSHLSLAGKALLEYLAGEKLPGLEALKHR